MPFISPVLTEIGQLGKTHGFKGHLRLYLFNELKDTEKFPEYLWIYRDGKPAPFQIDQLSFSSVNQGSVLFDDISFEEASALKTERVYVEESLFDSFFRSTEDLSFLTGYIVIDQKAGTVGQVMSVLDQPQHAILSVEKSGKEILIPYTDQIVLSVDETQKNIHVNLPDGLLEIYV